jgi:hypothetical protein
VCQIPGFGFSIPPVHSPVRGDLSHENASNSATHSRW